MITPLCAWFNEIARDDVAIAGGKGANLGDMAQADLPVPPGFVVMTHAFRQIVEQTGLWDAICDRLEGLDRNDTRQLQGIASQIQELFTTVEIDEPLRSSILAAYNFLGEGVPVAVRSSATAEDLAGASFAGQQETILNVITKDALLKAVCRCWSSLFTSQALFYRFKCGFDDDAVSMAVVVQKMVRAEKSGVSFTVEPVMHNRRQMMIEGVWGLGEGIVSGTITPDHYRVDRRTYDVIFEFVPEKKIMFCQNENGGIVQLPVPADRVSARLLSDSELRQLVDLGNQVEEHFGCPQDIEWAIEDDTIYLLQSRPITCL
jgi:pyruvate,water dikinase